jgi:hypothetical protein
MADSRSKAGNNTNKPGTPHGVKKTRKSTMIGACQRSQMTKPTLTKAEII